MYRLLGSLCIPLALTSFVRAAEEEADKTEEKTLFDRLDTNSDGFVTEDEVEGEQLRLFERLLRRADDDEDGKLNREEFQAGTANREPAQVEPERPAQTDRRPAPSDLPTPQQLLDRLDTNGDGKISREEAPERMRENFERIDADGSGDLSGEELARAIRAFAGRTPNQPQQRPGDAAPGAAGGFAVLRALDTDRDGSLSESEIADAPKALAALDRNKDGRITREELAPQTDSAPAAAARIFGRLRELDTDGNRRISREEAQGPIKERFDDLDTDSNGELDETEIRRMLEVFRERQQPREND